MIQFLYFGAIFVFTLISFYILHLIDNYTHSKNIKRKDNENDIKYVKDNLKKSDNHILKYRSNNDAKACLMKCKKHQYTYQIINDEISKIKDGEDIKDAKNVDFIVVDNCQDEIDNYKYKGEISLYECIDSLSSVTNNKCEIMIG